MKVFDEWFDKISALNLTTITRKSSESKVETASEVTLPTEPMEDVQTLVEHRLQNVYDNALENSITQKGTREPHAQRKEVESWKLGRYQASTESTTRMPILPFGKELDHKPARVGSNNIRTSQYGMSALSWNIKEQVLSRYALTASEGIRDAQNYVSLADYAKVELACENSDESAPLIDAPDSSESVSFQSDATAAEADETIMRESIDELETALNADEENAVACYQDNTSRLCSAADEPQLLSIDSYAPAAFVMPEYKLQDWDDSILFADLPNDDFCDGDVTPDQFDQMDSESMLDAARQPDSSPEILERLAKCDDFAVKWALSGNPSISLVTIWSLASDGNPAIRYRIADRANCPVEVLEVLRKDRDQSVSERARKTLMRVNSKNIVKPFGASQHPANQTLKSTGTEGAGGEQKLKAIFRRLNSYE